MKTNETDFNLRDVTNNDIEFIFQLRTQTMKKDFDNTFGWDEDEQWTRAADEIQHAQIITINQVDIGVIKVVLRSRHCIYTKCKFYLTIKGKA